jgi:putative oxidoreductase
MRTVLSDEPVAFQFFALFRAVMGLLILNHGLVVFNAEKMDQMAGFLGESLSMPMPMLMAYLAKGSEFFGGVLLVLGLFTRFACIPLFIAMAVAAFATHEGKIFSEAEPAFMYLVLFCAIFLAGSGKWSLDNLLFAKRDQKANG